MIEQLRPLFEGNQFLQGGAVLMVVGTAFAYMRNLPAQIWRWLRRRLFIDVEIQMRDDAFIWFADWLADQPYTQNWSRALTVRTTSKGCKEKEPPRILMSPAPGTHLLLWKGNLLIVQRIREDDQNASGSMNIFIPKETFRVSLLSPRRRTEIIKELLYEARSVSYPPDDDRVSIKVPQYDAWIEGARCRPRDLDSVILREGVQESLIKDINWFVNSEQWFIQRGIPYRRGYLLHGPPGNGKSSIVVALASHFKMDVCIIGLGTSNLSDSHLQQLMTSVPKHSVVLIEDIDCVFEERAKTDDTKNHITFSGLLNSIDGVMASEGRLLFMSTNHIEKLDPALIRPGRCDVQVEIKDADKDQARRLYQQFFPGWDGEAFAEEHGDKGNSMASLQGLLMGVSCETVS